MSLDSINPKSPADTFPSTDDSAQIGATSKKTPADIELNTIQQKEALIESVDDVFRKYAGDAALGQLVVNTGMTAATYLLNTYAPMMNNQINTAFNTPLVSELNAFGNLFGSFLYFSQTGVTAVSLAFKAQSIRSIESIIKTLKKEKEPSIELKNQIETLETYLKADKAKLKDECATFGVQTANYGFQFFQQVVVTGLKLSNNDLAKQILLPAQFVFSIVGSVLGAAMYGCNFGIKLKREGEFNKWFKSYESWQKNQTKTVDPSNTTTAVQVEGQTPKTKEFFDKIIKEISLQAPANSDHATSEEHKKFKEKFITLIRHYSPPSKTEADNLEDQDIEALSKELIKAAENYIDQKKTPEIILKNSLKDIIHKKLNSEKSFFNFQIGSTGILFLTSLVTGIITITLSAIALAGTAVPGLNAILYSLAGLSATMFISLFIAATIHSVKKKPAAYLADFNNMYIKILSSRADKFIAQAVVSYRTRQCTNLNKIALIKKKLSANDARKMERSIVRLKKSVSNLEKKQNELKGLEDEYRFAKWKDLAKESSLKTASSHFSIALNKKAIKKMDPDIKLSGGYRLDFQPIKDHSAKNSKAMLKDLQMLANHITGKKKASLRDILELSEAEIKTFLVKLSEDETIIIPSYILDMKITTPEGMKIPLKEFFLRDNVSHLAKEILEKIYVGVNGKSSQFDTLIALEEALGRCDFELMEDETKTLLKNVLGMNLKEVDKAIKENRHDIVRDAFLNFLVLGESSIVEVDLIEFMRKHPLPDISGNHHKKNNVQEE